MDSAICEAGTKSTVTSHPVDVGSSKFLEFDYHFNFTAMDDIGDLSVIAFFTPTGLIRRKILTISRSAINLIATETKATSVYQNNWKHIAVLLPLGNYNLAFEATCGLPYESNVALDNIMIREGGLNDLVKNGTHPGDVKVYNFSPEVNESKARPLADLRRGSARVRFFSNFK